MTTDAAVEVFVAAATVDKDVNVCTAAPPCESNDTFDAVGIVATFVDTVLYETVPAGASTDDPFTTDTAEVLFETVPRVSGAVEAADRINTFDAVVVVFEIGGASTRARI